MPLPSRYATQIPEMARVWEPAGYFEAQVAIWGAECQALHELDGAPTRPELDQLQAALRLTDAEIATLTDARGHETNRLLRTVQAKLPSHLGNFLHRGNTSSDVLDTSMALQTIRSLDLLRADLAGVATRLQGLALQHASTVQMGRTHGQHAVPQTFGRQVAGWYAEIQRDLERIARARVVIAVGKLSGEVGTSVFIRPELEERALAILGLTVDAAPTQVISRDRHAEVIGLLAVIAGTASRIAVDLSLLAITDVGEVREPFDPAVQQGSSAMPHKRNTELCERIRGLVRRVRGAALEELEAMDLWLERDISHSATERFVFPDAFGALSYALRLLDAVLTGLVVYGEQMRANVERTHGAIYGSRLLNALLDTDQIARTEAYELVKGLAQQALDSGTHLRELAAGNQRVVTLIGRDALPGLFEPDFYLRNVRIAYRRLGLDG